MAAEFYVWDDRPCRLSHRRDGSAEAEVFRIDEFVAAAASEIAREGILPGH
jgi:hypothetical protein